VHATGFDEFSPRGDPIPPDGTLATPALASSSQAAQSHPHRIRLMPAASATAPHRIRRRARTPRLSFRRLALLAVALIAPFQTLSAAAIHAEPLAPPSPPSGATLFTPLPPERTGIQSLNTYDDPRMWWELYQEFSIGALGTGVAIADYDRDGRPDIVVVNKTRPPRLFRNLGDWRFEDTTAAAGLLPNDGSTWTALKNWLGLAASANSPSPDGGWYQGAAFADINNDGWPDLYLCRFRAPNRLYINRGDGTFSEEAAARGLALEDASGMAAFADYDRDGWLDVYIQTNLLDVTASPDGSPDHLYRNNGDGTFTDVTVAAGLHTRPTQGHSATWWDADGDGWPDLYVANDFATPDFLYRNNNDGTFTDILDAVAPRTPFSSMGADIGDVDNDGRIDLFVTDMAATTIRKDLRGMADTRARHTAPPADEAPRALQFERNVLLLNTGTARLLEAAHLAGLDATDWTWSPRFEDIDNDGRIDLLVTNGMVRELHNGDLLARIMAAETPQSRVEIMKSSAPLFERNLAYRNEGDMRFRETGSAWGFDQQGISFGSALGDLDGDGDLDIVFTNFDDHPTVLRNDATSGHRVVISLEGTISNRFGVGATVRIETAAGIQVRTLTLARGYLSTSDPVLHFGLGRETTIRRLTVEWPSGCTQTFTDLQADRRYTITECETSSAAPSSPPATPRPVFSDVTDTFGQRLAWREIPLDESVIQPLLPQRFNRCGPRLAAGDLDGDDRPEIVVGGTTIDPAEVLRFGPGQTITRSRLPGSDSQPVNDGPVLIADLDADGDNDVLIAPGGVAARGDPAAYAPRLYPGHGDGTLGPPDTQSIPGPGGPIGALAGADLNRDGVPELFLGGRLIPGHYPEAPASLLLARHGDRYSDVTDALAPGMRRIGMVTAATFADLDRDGFPDLIVALDRGNVRLLRNRDGSVLSDATAQAGFTTAGTGRWSALAVGDFNEDGIPDIALGNLGLNTPYRASPDRPDLLIAGPFGNRNRHLALEARFDSDGTLRPWLPRRLLAPQIRALKRRFSTNDAYADAPLEDILGAARIRQAVRLETTELRSGVLLSQADGTWTFAPLPWPAQLAPIRAFAAADFDGDGHLDLFAAQNDYSPAPFIGPFDGGLSLLLTGDGRGRFTAVPPARSGIVIPGDTRDAVCADLNDDHCPDLFLTRSGASARVLINNAHKPHEP